MKKTRVRTAPARDVVDHAPTGKRIAYDPETRDFAMYLDGELVGFARTHGEAERQLDELAYEVLVRTHGPAVAA